MILGLLALGLAVSTAGAKSPACVAGNTVLVDEIEGLASPTAYTERGPGANATRPPAAMQYVCNYNCARSCRQSFGRCTTRECRQQFDACIRACGC
jgi:hypothetical protein